MAAKKDIDKYLESKQHEIDIINNFLKLFKIKNENIEKMRCMVNVPVASLILSSISKFQMCVQKNGHVKSIHIFGGIIRRAFTNHNSISPHLEKQIIDCFFGEQQRAFPSNIYTLIYDFLPSQHNIHGKTYMFLKYDIDIFIDLMGPNQTDVIDFDLNFYDSDITIEKKNFTMNHYGNNFRIMKKWFILDYDQILDCDNTEINVKLDMVIGNVEDFYSPHNQDFICNLLEIVIIEDDCFGRSKCPEFPLEFIIESIQNRMIKIVSQEWAKRCPRVLNIEQILPNTAEKVFIDFLKDNKCKCYCDSHLRYLKMRDKIQKK